MLTTAALISILTAGERSPAVVKAFADTFGCPLAAALPARTADGGHTSHDDDNKQFLYCQLFALPRPLRKNVEMMVSGKQEPIYNLGFTASHAWAYSPRHAHPAHLRWGFTIEAGKPFHEKSATRVLRGLLSQLPDRGLEVLPQRPVTGFTQPGKDPSLWLSFVGRCVTLDEIRDTSRSVEELVELARVDLLSLHAALGA